jgi:hypothetical protein
VKFQENRLAGLIGNALPLPGFKNLAEAFNGLRIAVSRVQIAPQNDLDRVTKQSILIATRAPCL